ncbi:MAG: DUF370 domain-containing protein [Candidatus Schekmanbacteria bacterium]|nr:MAG: DUF370 domain-containing protein [Candidatus Schekmanbacteria bacterium]
MNDFLINIGFNNMVVSSRIVAVVSPLSNPMKRMKEESKNNGKLIDVTQGRKTRAIIIMDSGHIILSALNPETISQRINGEESKKKI